MKKRWQALLGFAVLAMIGSLIAFRASSGTSLPGLGKSSTGTGASRPGASPTLAEILGTGTRLEARIKEDRKLEGTVRGTLVDGTMISGSRLYVNADGKVFLEGSPAVIRRPGPKENFTLVKLPGVIQLKFDAEQNFEGFEVIGGGP